MIPLAQHQLEIRRNLDVWQRKPLLRRIYAEFYAEILKLIRPEAPGLILEIGSGIGNLKTHLPAAITSDLFPNPWLDLVCDGYELPFADGSVSHLVLFDVFHHLRAPRAFLKEAKRVLTPAGRLILFEPFISAASYPAYACFHHEGLGDGTPLYMADTLPRPRAYYTGQGNATRLFFSEDYAGWMDGWSVFHRETFAAFRYLLSGGYSRPALYPGAAYEALKKLDGACTCWPHMFGARCLVGLQPDHLDSIPLG